MRALRCPTDSLVGEMAKYRSSAIRGMKANTGGTGNAELAVVRKWYANSLKPLKLH